MNKRNTIYTLILSATLLIIFSSYLSHMYPAYANDDSPETIAASYTLGIAHPPGYPLITMLGKISALILPGAPAFRMNTLSALLALLVLLSLFFTVKEIFNDETALRALTTSLAAMFALGFSVAFFAQALDAKGSVYMLNLLFLSIITLSCVKLLKSHRPAQTNLLFFIYGLSLANHWQSMIFMLPVMAAVLMISPVTSGKKRFLPGILFLLLGLTPYLFLLIRASGSPVIDHGEPSTITAMLRHILRLNYSGEFRLFSLYIFTYQFHELNRAVLAGFGPLILMSLIGIRMLIKENKGGFILVIASFFISALSIMLFFRRAQDSQCYYLPAAYFISILSAFSISAFSSGKSLTKKIIAPVLFSALMALLAFNSLEVNAMERDYLSYDYCNNLLKTPENNSAYFAFSDFDTMPLYYQQYVEKKRPDLKIIRSSFLAFDWGIKQFKAEFPGADIAMVPGKPGLNMKNTVLNFSKTEPVYGGYPFEVASIIGIPHEQDGIMLKTGGKTDFPRIFEAYSYRGIYDSFYLKNEDNFRLVSNYAGAMNNCGSAFLTAGNPAKAVEYYKLSLLFPYNNSRCGFYKNLARAYKMDKQKEKSIKFEKLAEVECRKKNTR